MEEDLLSPMPIPKNRRNLKPSYTPPPVPDLKSSCGFLGFNPTPATTTQIIDHAILLKNDLRVCSELVSDGMLKVGVPGAHEKCEADARCGVVNVNGTETCALKGANAEAMLALFAP